MQIRNNVLIVLIVLLLGVITIFGVLIYQGKNMIVSNPTIKQAKTYPKDLTGKIYLTLKEKNSDKQGVYYFDLDKSELKELNINTGCETVGGELNPFGDRILISSNCEQENLKNYQLYHSNLDNSNLRFIISGISRKNKKEMTWSSDGKTIAFMDFVGLEDDKEETKLKNWSIFTSDLSGNEKFVINAAAYPFYVGDKKLLVMKKGGLSIVNTEISSGEVIYPFQETHTLMDYNYDVSNNKKLIAVTNNLYEDKKIEIIKVNSWDSFDYKKVAEISTSKLSSFSPKFNSQNNRYVAVKQIRTDKKSLELVVYDTETKKKYSIFNLDKYESVEIGDWR